MGGSFDNANKGDGLSGNEPRGQNWRRIESFSTVPHPEPSSERWKDGGRDLDR